MKKDIDTGKLMRELGIAKKKIETLKKELEAEKAKGEAYEQLRDINLAMMTAIVRNIGEVEVRQSDINDCLNNGIQTAVDYVGDGRMILRVQEDDSPEGR